MALPRNTIHGHSYWVSVTEKRQTWIGLCQFAWVNTFIQTHLDLLENHSNRNTNPDPLNYNAVFPSVEKKAFVCRWKYRQNKVSFAFSV